MKKKFKNKIIELLIFLYFNILNFELPIVLHSVVPKFYVHPKF